LNRYLLDGFDVSCDIDTYLPINFSNCTSFYLVYVSTFPFIPNDLCVFALPHN
jgi:hypothetical protein